LLIHTYRRLKPLVGYCFLSCGADIIFAEALLALGADLHVIMPFNLQDFYETSVDYGLPSMRSWKERCDKCLSLATHVNYATTERYLGAKSLFPWAQTMLKGLCTKAALELNGGRPTVIVLLDPAHDRSFVHKFYTEAKTERNPLLLINLRDLCE
jgi:hypothetical protein